MEESRAFLCLVMGAFVGIVPAARAQTAPSDVRRTINPRDGLTYEWIPPAAFRMGCLGPILGRPRTADADDCLSNELPRHSVTLTKGFWLGQTLVTQLAYNRVMGADRL